MFDGLSLSEALGREKPAFSILALWPAFMQKCVRIRCTVRSEKYRKTELKTMSSRKPIESHTSCARKPDVS